MATTNYVWDPEIDAYLMETDESHATTATYTVEPTYYGRVVSQHTGGTTQTLHFDALGSTREITNESENVVGTNMYDAWGVNRDPTGTADSPFKWIGELGYYLDRELGSYNVRTRTLRSAIARWMSLDPSGASDGPNRYQYVANTPARHVDPSGLVLLECHYHSTRNSRAFTRRVDCSGLVDTCCPRLVGRGGNTARRTGWGLVGAGPDTDPPLLCARMAWQNMKDPYDKWACCVEQYTLSAAIGAVVVIGGVAARPPLGYKPAVLGEPKQWWKLRKAMTHTSYRDYFVKHKGWHPSGRGATFLKSVGRTGYCAIIAAGVYSTAVMLACAKEAFGNDRPCCEPEAIPKILPPGSPRYPVPSSPPRRLPRPGERVWPGGYPGGAPAP